MLLGAGGVVLTGRAQGAADAGRGSPVELRDLVSPGCCAHRGGWSESTVYPVARPRARCARVRTGKPGSSGFPTWDGRLIDQILGKLRSSSLWDRELRVCQGGQRVLTAVPAHVESPGQSPVVQELQFPEQTCEE